MLRRSHEHHRDLRARLNTSISTAAANRDQDRYVMITIITSQIQNTDLYRRSSIRHGGACANARWRSQHGHRSSWLKADPHLAADQSCAATSSTNAFNGVGGHHAPRLPHANPHSARGTTTCHFPRFPCMGLFLSRSFLRAVHPFFLLCFGSFFVRSGIPFLRPDPQYCKVGARRSCQGWPSRQPFGVLRPCQATP